MHSRRACRTSLTTARPGACSTCPSAQWAWWSTSACAARSCPSASTSGWSTSSTASAGRISLTEVKIKQKRTFDEEISCVQLKYFIRLISSSRQRGSQDRGQGQREEGRAVQEVPGGAQDRPHGVHQGQRATVPRPHPLRVHGLDLPSSSSCWLIVTLPASHWLVLVTTLVSDWSNCNLNYITEKRQVQI